MSTLTPVACVKAFMSATKASSSDWTKYFQRSIESWAPGSGFQGEVCAQALAKSRRLVVEARASAAPPFSAERRSRWIMGRSSGSGLLGERCGRPVAAEIPRSVQSSPAFLVEEMGEVRHGAELDGFAGSGLHALAEHGGDLLAAGPRPDLGLRAGWLHHHHLGR